MCGARGGAAGMARGNTRFEVQVFKTDHWVLGSVFEGEDEARHHARTLLSGGRAEGVRVLKDWCRADGRHVETEVYTEFRSVSRAILAAPLDEAPRLCSAAADLYALDARIAINRLLRNYTQRIVVTPTELLHHHGEIKRLSDRDSLLAGAVGRAAALQADKGGLDGRARRDELFGFVDALTGRAHAAAARRDLPDLDHVELGDAWEALRGEGAEEQAFLARVALARSLVPTRNWLAKLDRLAEMAQREADAPEPLALVDGLIADVLGAPAVAQDLLGRQNGLAEALCALLDLSRGRLDPAGRPDDDRAVRLSELLAFHDLEDTRRVLLDMVRRQLRGTAPLARAGPAAEETGFRNILLRTITPSGVLGGPPMADALVQRALRFQEAGGTTGRRQAMAAVAGWLPAGAAQVRFLIALAGSESAAVHQDDIARLLDRAVEGGDALARFVDPAAAVIANLEALTGLYADVADAAINPMLRQRVADRIDDLLVQYIERSRVVERLDNPSDILRHRAIRLMQLCAPGTLKSRRALDVVRRRVVQHLRQPEFDRRFVEDIADPALQRKALRDFYQLLAQAGLR